MIKQTEITIDAKPRGFHLITDEILKNVDIKEIKTGLIHIFLKHSSASLSINENADPTVRDDLENVMNDLCDHKPYYQHTNEGHDDMPAHVKSSLFGVSLTIPITDGRLNMGTWQGIYLGEHRDHARSRKIVVTIQGQ